MDDCLSEDTVAALLDGALDAERFARAERHLSECEACLALVAQVGRALNPDPEVDRVADETPELGPGTAVGRYRIVALLGAGGMGRVYAAEDPTLDRKVALKLLHRSSTTADLEARLLREAKAMARLSHPEVITIHDVGHHGHQLFIAMELVDGGTLRQWLASGSRTWREILGVYLRAGRGLARAHAAGIIHRDFKPDNVLVGSDGRVRVTDFGLARAEGAAETESKATLEEASTMDVSLTRTGTLVGTPAYMAPEQLAGAPADARSDLYGFCVALHEALCGVRPFAGTTFRALQEAKLSGAIAGNGRGRRVPQRVLRALAIGLRARPADRYKAMDALLAALERASRTPRWPIAAGAALLLGATAAGAAAARARHPAPVAVAAVAGCTSNRACVEQNGGTPYLCRASDHACVAIASEDCVAKYEPQDLLDDDTVWLGSMFPAKGPGAADFGEMNLASVDLARSEIAQATRAFDGPGAAKHVRRIALVACDDSADSSRAARHLVDIGVPAVMGFRSGQEVVDIAGSLLIGRDVLTVATLTASPLVTRLPQPGHGPRLVWRTTYNVNAVGEATSKIIEDILAPRYEGAPVSVTLVCADTAGARSFAEKVFQTLHINGKPAIDSKGTYYEVKIPARPLRPDEVPEVAKRIAETKPSIVVMLGDSSISPVVGLVDEQMTGARHKPSYLGALYPTSLFSSFIGTSVERRRRVYAVESFSGSVANARFVIRYNETNPSKVTRTLNGGASYDAFYLLAYATFAGDQSPPTGSSIARSFARLIGPGRQIAVGPSDVFDALTALGRGETIDLEGTQSNLDFDLSTGDEPSNFALLCSGVDASGRASGEDIESGVIYDATKKKLAGSLNCP